MGMTRVYDAFMGQEIESAKIVEVKPGGLNMALIVELHGQQHVLYPGLGFLADIREAVDDWNDLIGMEVCLTPKERFPGRQRLTVRKAA